MQERLLRFIILFGLGLTTFKSSGQDIVIGSKTFPESRLLAEIMAQLITEHTDLEVERRFGLGGTLISYEALISGEIDIYPEYTGTVAKLILKSNQDQPDNIRRELLKDLDIVMGPSFGFSNTYILAARQGLNIQTISEAVNRDDLQYGFSNEFLQREDGYAGLSKVYGAFNGDVKGIDHGLAYKALEAGEIDITDAYSTDGKLANNNFRLLEDDKNFFPDYMAVPLIKKSTWDKYPELERVMDLIADRMDEETMRKLNYAYEVQQKPPGDIAFAFLKENGLIENRQELRSLPPLVKQSLEHIQLTFIATGLAVLIAIPMGIFIARRRRLSGTVLTVTGVIQTIPSLALLGFMIPLFGIGFLPAIIALFLYALLPILRNTYTGILSTDPILIEAARALGMTPGQILFKVQLPLCTDTILAGVRTALTINIGTATLAAFIGAGGLGESIITGITLNDNSIILRGAIPAAILALVADLGMGLLSRKFRVPGKSS